MIIIITICILGLIAFTVYKCSENDHLDNLNNELRTHYENILKDKKKYLMSKNISFKTNEINDDFNITEACLRSDEYIAINVCEEQKVNQERYFNKTPKHLSDINTEFNESCENWKKNSKQYLMSQNIRLKTNEINYDFNISEPCLRSDEYIAINVCEKQKVNQERSFNKTIKDLSDSKTESMKSCENGKNDIKQYLMSRNISFKTNETNADFNLSEPFQRKLSYIMTNIYDEENLLHEEGLKKVLLALKNDFTYYYLE